jgi:hypothetical protein
MMLKFFFWILLLANGALLVYQQGYFDALLPSAREPARMREQFNADKIKLIPEPAPAPEASAKPEAIACAEIGNFDPEDAKRFSEQLAALSLGERVKEREIREAASHMVFIPPLADKAGADKKAGELRNLGIEDFYIIQDNSSMRWGISLGVFRQEEAARAHLADLSRKGVRSARIGQRSVASTAVAFQLREIDAETKRALDRIKESFPKQETRPCQP